MRPAQPIARSVAILLLRLWQGCQVCVKISAELPPKASLQCFDAVGWTAEGHPACKNRVVGAGVVVCLERGADLHMAQLMPLPLTVSCFSKIQIGFTFLVPAHLGCPGKRAVKRVCVCVRACVRACVCVPPKAYAI